MNSYEQMVGAELKEWQKKITKRSSLVERYAKSVQKKVNKVIPDKVHDVVTTSVKTIVKGALLGSEYTTKRHVLHHKNLEEREQLVKGKLLSYRRTAIVEGAGTGAGGLLLGVADFPLLLSIKMKFLFDAASIYGFDVKDYRERLYIIYLFQLAFSSDDKRKEAYEKIVHWDETVNNYPVESTYLEQLDWKTFQQEYRDYMDLAKLLQLIPGIGAVFGAYSNYKLLDELGEVAMNGYRMRWFSK
ncbi:EcsC family protein [Bacillus taeanensis]|uniref:EcsC family protein n=1 Tax=Bacillus taeanensis TaxID=273032 RepID=A0A366XVY5_9BACI|nr:EcsC family protein [Bacillus taeanensis]RBW69315.1 EcsC family protein [Bacillus taeanensis]